MRVRLRARLLGFYALVFSFSYWSVWAATCVFVGGFGDAGLYLHIDVYMDTHKGYRIL